ncbi:glycosyltransferase [Peribacillus frigoritolerans]|uniref:glycosyltransferase n=1 Tax=Peribacillus frigoritolerans TaxID=450367 RepID=UPI003D28BB63
MRLRERSGKIKRILITFGGSDTTNETLKVLKAIESINMGSVLVDVIVGRTYPNKFKLIQYCKKKNKYTAYFQVNNMAELMIDADLLIGSGGTTTWERCFLACHLLQLLQLEIKLK